MKNLCALSITLALFYTGYSQEKLKTRTGNVTFLSETGLEKIYAENDQTASLFLVEKKTIAFNALLKSFKFEKALMEEHFNEKYVHSDKYPAAKFLGTFEEDIDLKKPETYKDVTIKGEMDFHGVTLPLVVKADITVIEDGSITFVSKFKLNLEDYKIDVPSLVRDKISKEVLVSVATSYSNNPTK